MQGTDCVFQTMRGSSHEADDIRAHLLNNKLSLSQSRDIRDPLPIVNFILNFFAKSYTCRNVVNWNVVFCTS